MKKTVYVLNVDGYAPEVTAITYPLIERYADKIGANLHRITQRKFPKWPVVYEKLQIGELAVEHGNDWNIYIDSDALVHPETVDFTDFVAKDTVLHNGADVAPVRWTYDHYFRRDGRHTGSCNWLTMSSDWTVEDLYRPLDMTPKEALRRIWPTVDELNSGVVDAAHLVDDYTLSRNIARYGLKFRSVLEIQPEVGLGDANFFWHAYTIPVDEKIRQMREVLAGWNIPAA